MTEAQVVRVLQELGKLWQEYEASAASGDAFLPISVLSLRFGLMGGDPQTFERVGELMGIAPERARDIENELLGRLARAASIV